MKINAKTVRNIIYAVGMATTIGSYAVTAIAGIIGKKKLHGKIVKNRSEDTKKVFDEKERVEKIVNEVLGKEHEKEKRLFDELTENYKKFHGVDELPESVSNAFKDSIHATIVDGRSSDDLSNFGKLHSLKERTSLIVKNEKKSINFVEGLWWFGVKHGITPKCARVLLTAPGIGICLLGIYILWVGGIISNEVATMLQATIDGELTFDM